MIENHTELDLASNLSSNFYRIDLAYIGTKFQGWQSQPSGLTVQDEIERALEIVLRKPTRIIGASRTDSGVHAEHQVALFKSDKIIEEHRLLRSLNAILPKTIGVKSVATVDSTFHPIYSAQAKLYRYRLGINLDANPFILEYVWSCRGMRHVDTMILESKYLLGLHDFSSFCASDSSVSTFDREIFDIRWIRGEKYLEFYILGSGFLKQMVRSIVGTLVEVCQGKHEEGAISRILGARDRTQGGMTAPPQGLSLVQIFYDDTQSIPEKFLPKPDCFSILV